MGPNAIHRQISSYRRPSKKDTMGNMHSACFFYHHQEVHTLQTKIQNHFRISPVPQAASLCTGSPSEARVRGIRQTKPAAMDKTSLSIPHETKRRARNTNPGGLAVSCSLFFCPSVMRQCAWVLNHLLLGGRTPSLKLCVRASQHRLDRDAAAPWLCSWWQRLCSACQCGSQRSSSVAGAPNGESSWPTPPSATTLPRPWGPSSFLHTRHSVPLRISGCSGCGARAPCQRAAPRSLSQLHFHLHSQEVSRPARAHQALHSQRLPNGAPH